MEAMINRVNRIWCEIMHNAPMWPMHGQYECRTCGRHYNVEWAGEPAHAPTAPIATWKLARASK
jgi:hypothetical protein